MFCRLPLELMVKNIVNAVVQSGDVKSLAHMALVCHALHTAVRPYLFRHVIVDSPERCHALLDFVQQDGIVNDGIQSLTLQSRQKGFTHSLGAIPIFLLSLPRNLRTLRWLDRGGVTPISIHLRVPGWIRIHLPHIDTLHLELVDFVSVNDFARFLLAFSGLRNMRLTEVKVERTSVLLGTLKTRLSASPCIRSLEVRRLSVWQRVI